MRRSRLDSMLPAVHSRLLGLVARSVLVASAGCEPLPELEQEASLEEAEQGLSASVVASGNILIHR